jgi:hypothetical protein
VRLQQQGGGVADGERLAHEPDVATDAGDRAVPQHEPFDEAGRVAVGEHLGEHHVWQVPGQVGQRVGHPPRRRDRGQRREAVGVGMAALGGEVGLGEVGQARCRAGGHVAEMALHQHLRGFEIEVASHRDDGVADRVVLVEELGRVGDGGRFEVVERAVPVVGVRVGVEHDGRQLQPREPAVRPVQDIDANLFLDDVDLVAQVLLGKPRAAHAVGLQKQRALQRVARKRLVVIGVVEVGGPVEGAAAALHVPEVGELFEVGRALEHQVFEEVGEPGATLRFGPDADVVHHRHPDDGSARIGGQDHAQAVGKRDPFDGVMRGG